MLASNYRHRIRILEVTIEVDELLQEIEVIKEIGSFWADIRTLKGEDIQTAGTEFQKNTFRFIMRYNPTIRSNMIIEYQGQRYDIDEIVNDNMRNKTLTIIGRTKLGL
ncbi:phage head closure protein [Lysinibacillus sp. RC79]|uniref:phage head closure protein n=1 Tax=Lysinibacillus sp. RC79 TaxID=3156296 RepID=UPI0035162574